MGKKELLARIHAEYGQYRQKFLQMEPQASFEKAEEISATKHLYRTLQEYLPERYVPVLSRFDEPLKVIRTLYMEEHDGVSLSDLEHTLWLIQDRNKDYLELFDAGEKVKPACSLDRVYGNMLNMAGVAASTLQRHGMQKEALELIERITSGKFASTEDICKVISEYVTIIRVDENGKE